MTEFIKSTTRQWYVLNMKALGLMVAGKKYFFFFFFFLSFSHYKSVVANDSQGGANLDPRGLVGWIYVEYHWTLLHTKYYSSGPRGFGEEF